VPTYDAVCSGCGLVEITRPIARFRDPLVCPGCGTTAVFKPSVPNCRIDDQVNVGSERRDGTAGQNLGLPGVGEGRDYRPITGHELGSNGSARERAKRHGLTPVDSGRYRTLGS